VWNWTFRVYNVFRFRENRTSTESIYLRIQYCFIDKCPHEDQIGFLGFQIQKFNQKARHRSTYTHIIGRLPLSPTTATTTEKRLRLEIRSSLLAFILFFFLVEVDRKFYTFTFSKSKEVSIELRTSIILY